MPTKPSNPDRDPLSGEVDRLLRQLGPRPDAGAPRSPAPRPRPGPPPPPLSIWLPSPLGVWARAALVAVLAAAMTQWPYATCGWGLALYLAASGVVLVAGAWAAYASWRRRMGLAHTAAIVLVFSGLALAAYHVLPRIGYGPAETAWRCIG